MENKKVVFNGENISVFVRGQHYEFIVLGDGVIPIGDNRDFHSVFSIRSYLKKNYKDKLRKIKIEQSINEK